MGCISCPVHQLLPPNLWRPVNKKWQGRDGYAGHADTGTGTAATKFHCKKILFQNVSNSLYFLNEKPNELYQSVLMEVLFL